MGAGKRNTEIKKIEDKSARYVCFSKRREGLFKKAHQYHTISGSLIAVLVISPAGRSYVHGSPSFDPIVNHFLQSSTAASMMTMKATGTGSTAQFLDSSTAASMVTMTAVGTSSTAQLLHGSMEDATIMTMTTSGTSSSSAGSCVTESSVSDSASTDVGLKEQVEAMNVEGCDNLEGLLEMKRKLEEVREKVLTSFADSLLS